MSSSLCKSSSPFDLRLLSHSLTDLFTSCFLSLFLLLPDLVSLRQYTMRPPPVTAGSLFLTKYPHHWKGTFGGPLCPETEDSQLWAQDSCEFCSPRALTKGVTSLQHLQAIAHYVATEKKLPHTDRLTAMFPTVRSCGKGRCRLGCRAVLPSSNRMETINIILNLLLTALTVEEKQ